MALLGKDPAVSESILEAVRQREQRMSTGIGRGIAIPHGKSDLVQGVEIACGVAAAPIDFASLDREPARIFFLLVSSQNEAQAHLSALGKIARLVGGAALADELLASRTPDEFLRALERNDEDDE